MSLNKSRTSAIYGICVAGAIIISGVVLFLLMNFGIGYDSTPDGGLGQGLAVALGVIFAILLMIALAAIAIVALIEGVLLLIAIGNKRNLRWFALVTAILKFLVFPIAMVLSFLSFWLSIWLVGAVGFLLAVAVLISAIFDLLAFSEMKNYFIWLAQMR